MLQMDYYVDSPTKRKNLTHNRAFICALFLLKLIFLFNVSGSLLYLKQSFFLRRACASSTKIGKKGARNQTKNKLSLCWDMFLQDTEYLPFPLILRLGPGKLCMQQSCILLVLHCWLGLTEAQDKLMTLNIRKGNYFKAQGNSHGKRYHHDYFKA